MDSYSLQYEQEMWDAIASSDRDSSDAALLADSDMHRVKATPLRAYPGWVVREYASGMYDATSTRGALSPGFSSFREAVAWVRTQA